MRLEQDTVDLLQINDLGAVADGLEQGAEAQIFDPSEYSFGRADDERERVVGEGGVREGDPVELTADKVGEASGASLCIKTE